MEIFRVTPPYRSETRNIILKRPSVFSLRTIITSLICRFVEMATFTKPSTLTARCNEIQCTLIVLTRFEIESNSWERSG